MGFKYRLYMEFREEAKEAFLPLFEHIHTNMGLEFGEDGLLGTDDEDEMMRVADALVNVDEIRENAEKMLVLRDEGIDENGEPLIGIADIKLVWQMSEEQPGPDEKHMFTVDIELDGAINAVKAGTICDNGLPLRVDGSDVRGKIRELMEMNGFEFISSADGEESGLECEVREALESDDIEEVGGDIFKSTEPLVEQKVFFILDKLFELYPILDTKIPGTDRKCALKVNVSQLGESHKFI